MKSKLLFLCIEHCITCFKNHWSLLHLWINELLHVHECFIILSSKFVIKIFTSQDVNWWIGVVLWCFFLSAVWTLILTAPIHCRWSIGEQVMQCYISPNLFRWKTNSSTSWMAWVYVYFGVNCPFNEILIGDYFDIYLLAIWNSSS